MEYDFSFYGLATDIAPPLKVRWQETKRTVNLNKNCFVFKFFSGGAPVQRRSMSSWSSKRSFMGMMRFQKSSCFSVKPFVSEARCFNK